MNFLRNFRNLGPLRPIQLSRTLPPQKIHGRLLESDPTIKSTGLRHFQRILSPMEAKTLYDQARTHGEAYFQDNLNRNFSLVYDKGTRAYHLIKREHG